MLDGRMDMAQDGDMKPPLFDYYDPSTEAEALALLVAYGPDAKILAGGQSLMPLLNMRLHGLFTGENLGKMLVKLPARMAVS
jgi:hypothetical protein